MKIRIGSEDAVFYDTSDEICYSECQSSKADDNIKNTIKGAEN